MAVTGTGQSHTYCPPECVQDAYGCPGNQAVALPAMGYNVPEPATWAMMLLGFGLIGTGARRARPVRAV